MKSLKKYIISFIGTFIFLSSAFAEFNIIDGFNVAAGRPVDSRFVFDSVSNMYKLIINNRYEGLLTFVKENNTFYHLVDGISNSNWLSFGETGSDRISKITNLVDDIYLNIDGDTVYDEIYMSNNKISGLANPVNLQDAVAVKQLIAFTNGFVDSPFGKTNLTSFVDDVYISLKDGGSYNTTITNLTVVDPINFFSYANFKVGRNAGVFAWGSNTLYLGEASGYDSKGRFNVFLGDFAGFRVQGNDNLCLGGANGLKGDDNICLGERAGQYAISSNNLYLGTYAGEYQTNDYKAYFGRYTSIDCNTARIVNVSAAVNDNDVLILSQLVDTTNAFANNNKNLISKSYGAGSDTTLTNLTVIGSINDFRYSNFKANLQAGLYANGSNNIYIGRTAGVSANGNYNMYLSCISAGYNAIGNRNTYVGDGHFLAPPKGNFNFYLGEDAGYNSSGDRNIYIGYKAGFLSVSTNNLFLGNVGTHTGTNIASLNGFTMIDCNTAKIVKVSAAIDDNDVVVLSQFIAFSNTLNNSSTDSGIFISNENGIGYNSTISNLTTISAVNNFVNNNFKAGSRAGLSLVGNYNNCLGRNSGRLANGNYNNYFGMYAGNEANGDYNNYFGRYAGNEANGDYNSFFGRYAGNEAFGQYNNYFGRNSGDDANGDYNIYFGRSAGQNSVGDYNNYFGKAGGYAVGSSNTYLGNDVGNYVDGSCNNYIGNRVGVSAEGSESIYIGTKTAESLLGDYNIALGWFSAKSAIGNNNVYFDLCGWGSTGSYNAWIGLGCGVSNNGDLNTSFALSSGRNSIGDYNSFVGFGANSSTGNYNNYYGVNAGRLSYGDYNNSLGTFAGMNLRGNYNTCLGYMAGQTTTSSYGCYIGGRSGYCNDDVDYGIELGFRYSKFYARERDAGIGIGYNVGYNNKDLILGIGYQASSSVNGGVGTCIGSSAGRYLDHCANNFIMGSSAGNYSSYVLFTHCFLLGKNARVNDGITRKVKFGDYEKFDFNETECINIGTISLKPSDNFFYRPPAIKGTIFYNGLSKRVMYFNGATWNNLFLHN